MAPSVVREVYADRLSVPCGRLAAVHLELFEEALIALSLSIHLLAVQTESSAADIVDALTLIMEGRA